MLKTLLAAAVVVSVFAGLSFAWTSDATLQRVYSNGGTQATVSCAAAAGNIGTLTGGDLNTVGGFVINTSTWTYDYVSFTTTSSTGTTYQAIAANYFLVYPAGDTYGRDRFPLNQGNTIYRGPIYFYSIDSTDLSTKRVGTMSIMKWK